MTADKLNQVVAASIPVVANEEIFQKWINKVSGTHGAIYLANASLSLFREIPKGICSHMRWTKVYIMILSQGFINSASVLI